MSAHPYRTAWQTRDMQQRTQAMADDVALHSPVILSAPVMSLRLLLASADVISARLILPGQP